MFSEQNGQGGTSYLLGATTQGEKRDSITVAPFTCEKFESSHTAGPTGECSVRGRELPRARN
jgi:hypothetical protein